MSRHWILPSVALLPVAVLLASQESPNDGTSTEKIVEEVAEPRTIPIPGARPLLPLAAASRTGFETRPMQAPFLVARADGTVLLGSLVSELGTGDRIELRDVAPDGAVAAEGRPLSSPPSEIIRPVAALDGEGRLIVAWTGLVDGKAQLVGCRETEKGFAPPAPLTRGPLPALNPELALHSDGRVYAAWEGEVAAKGGARPGRDVFVAAIGKDGALGTPIAVGAGPFSELDAVIASRGKELWVAWVGYGGRDYEIRLRSLDPAKGELGPVIEVSADASADDLHPAIAAAPSGELWVAWDRVEVAQRGSSTPRSMLLLPDGGFMDVSVRCACVRPGDPPQVLLPRSGSKEAPDGVVAGAPLLSTGGGQPRLGFDRAGRLWIALRWLRRNPNTTRHEYAYPVLLQRLDADGWSAPLEVGESGGIPEQAALVARDDGVLAAFACDDRLHFSRAQEIALPRSVDAPLRKKGIDSNLWNGPASIGTAIAAAPIAAAAAPALAPRTARLEPPHFHPAGDPTVDPYLSGERHFEVARGEQRWSVYFGDLHRHSSVSRCSNGMEPTPADRWVSGRDVLLFDFMALTDHTTWIDPLSWWQLDKLGWLYQSSGFCTLLGWEWSSGKVGHHNVIFRGRTSALVNQYKTLEQLYTKLDPDAAVVIPHCGSDKKFPVDFAQVDDRHEQLIEIYQALRGNYEFDGCFRQAPNAAVAGGFAHDALAQGRKVGFVAATDHGYGASYACVLADRLDRESVFAALHARRTYGATAKAMLIDLRVDDAVMGESTVANGSPKVRLTARGTAELADVVVFRNGAIWRSLRKQGPAANRQAPLRLVARVEPAAPLAAAWSVRARASGASFDALQEMPASGREPRAASRPEWKAKGDEAVFTLPAGFAAAAPASFAVHFWKPADGGLEIAVGDARRELAAGGLAAGAIELPAGAPCSLALEPADAAIDLAHGLGTREFTGEWEDAALPAGDSWYYARFVQVDGEMAWSSPIYVTKRAP
jgi:hypothetical protein